MRGGEDEVFFSINQSGFFGCKRTPKQKHDMFFFVRNFFDDGVGKSLPAEWLVGVRPAGSHAKGAV